ncbi:MAG TPA: TetR/AcrR family transcriptional regulator [Polyangiales bacterium]
MASSETRQRMIDAAARMFQQSGYHATSWRDLVQEAGTPWGSAFHHFPAGKHELGCAAVEQAGERGAQLVRASFLYFPSPAEAVRAWVKLNADTLEQSGFADGCPIAGVAADADVSEQALRKACSVAWSALCEAIAEALIANGVSKPRARALATLTVSTVEGGLLLSRASQSVTPLRQVGAELAALLEAACGAPARPQPPSRVPRGAQKKRTR